MDYNLKQIGWNWSKFEENLRKLRCFFCVKNIKFAAKLDHWASDGQICWQTWQLNAWWSSLAKNWTLLEQKNYVIFHHFDDHLNCKPQSKLQTSSVNKTCNMWSNLFWKWINSLEGLIIILVLYYCPGRPAVWKPPRDSEAFLECLGLPGIAWLWYTVHMCLQIYNHILLHQLVWYFPVWALSIYHYKWVHAVPMNIFLTQLWTVKLLVHKPTSYFITEEATKYFFCDKIIWENAYCEVTKGSKGV